LDIVVTSLNQKPRILMNSADSGIVQTLKDVPADQRLQVEESH
jgi:hypothetical protein